MDINITHTMKIEAPEIVEAIIALIKANGEMRVTNLVHNGEVPGKDLEATSRQSEEKNNNVTPNMEPAPITLEDVRTKLVQLSNQGKHDQVKALINKFGATKLHEVPEDKYGKLLKEAEKC